MFTIDWLAHPLCRLLTLTLLHFVWQGLAIGLTLVVLVELCNVHRATARYACSLAALLAMTVCPLATLVGLALNQPNTVSASAVIDFSAARIGLPPRLHWLEACQPYALSAWLAGVMLFGSRLLTGAVGVVRLHRGRMPLPLKLTAVVERLGKQMKIDALPLVFLSRQVAEAMAVGLVRPLVLIPAAWATEMPLDMLEAVIAHELAHLRRRDLWVNLLQRIVETLLFYHPAVWWLSRRLRIERELCADELAVAATGKRLEYAQALEQIANERQADIRPALAAFLRGETNMRLLQRVRNVLGQSPSERSRLWPAGILALALPLGLWAATAVGGAAVADDDDEVNKPTIKRVRDGETEERRIIIRNKQDGDARDSERGALKEKPIREETYRRKPAPSKEEVIERKIFLKDGKPIVEVELGKGLERGSREDRRLDELTALVKRLASQVERLQDEVSQLRGGSASDKKYGQREEELARARQKEAENRFRKIDEARHEQDRAKDRVAEEKEKAIEWAKEARERLKERAIEQQERTAEPKERAIEQKRRAEEERAEQERAGRRERERKEGAQRDKGVDESALSEKLRALGKLAELKKLEGLKFADKDFKELPDRDSAEALKKAIAAREIGEKAAAQAREQAEKAKAQALESIKRAAQRKKELGLEKQEGEKEKPLKKSLKEDRDDGDDGDDQPQ
jgi:beta-lactamase regulating signal transducer with metallopeptidase domain